MRLLNILPREDTWQRAKETTLKACPMEANHTLVLTYYNAMLNLLKKQLKYTFNKLLKNFY
jgi:hypothetical protein